MLVRVLFADVGRVDVGRDVVDGDPSLDTSSRIKNECSAMYLVLELK